MKSLKFPILFIFGVCLFTRMSAQDDLDKLKSDIRFNMEAGNYVTSIELINNLIVKSDPDSVTANILFHLAQCHFFIEEFEPALRNIDLALEKGIEEESLHFAYFIKATSLLSLERYKEGLPWINKTINLKPDYIDKAYFFRGLIRMGMASQTAANVSYDNYCDDFIKASELGYEDATMLLQKIDCEGKTKE